MFQNLGMGEILIIALVLMVIFGGQKFPEMARGITQAIKEFRTALDDDEDEGPEPVKKTKKKG